MCAQKLTLVSLIYHTEPKTKKWKREKLKSKKQICSEVLKNSPISLMHFSALHYASIVLAMALCLSVHLSQASIVSKQLDKSSWVLAWRLPFTYPTLCFREIWACPKIRVLPSGTLSQTLDWKISPRQVDQVNKTRRL